MRAVIDSDRCQGHGQCFALAPEVFEPSDELDGHGVVLRDPVPPDQLEAVRRAEVACPEAAITLVSGEGQS